MTYSHFTIPTPRQQIVIEHLNRVCERHGPSNVARAMGVAREMLYHWRKGRRRAGNAAAWRIIDLDAMTEKQVNRLVEKRIKMALTGKY